MSDLLFLNGFEQLSVCAFRKNNSSLKQKSRTFWKNSDVAIRKWAAGTDDNRSTISKESGNVAKCDAWTEGILIELA